MNDEPMPIDELKAQLEELDDQPQAQPPADADQAKAMAIIKQMDHVISQANIVKKLIYGGAAASVIRRDISALLAQMDRDIGTAVKANNQLAPGEVYPASWRQSGK
jgi:hypothetical protein